MGLSLNDLTQGREIIHDVTIDALGDSVKIRELSTKQLDSIFQNNKREDGGNGLSENGVKELLISTLTDDDNGRLTPEMCDAFISENQNSVIKEITDKIVSIHGGSGAGES